MLLKFAKGNCTNNAEYSMGMEKMSRLIFEKHFER